MVAGDVASGKDKQYKTDGTEQQIVWSIGPINSLDQAAKHHALNGRITGARTLAISAFSLSYFAKRSKKNFYIALEFSIILEFSV